MSLARYLSKLGALLGSDGKVPAAALAAGAARANLDAGAILQVVTVTSNEWVTRNTSSWGTIFSNLNAAITPIRSNSKLLLVGEVTYNQNTTISYIDHFRFFDATNSAEIGVGNSLGSRNKTTTALRGSSFDANDVSFANMRASIDAGSTTARTYTIQHRTEGAASRLFNHSNLDVSTAGWTAVSNLTIYEVAA